jgi:nicotinamidase-related amidase
MIVARSQPPPPVRTADMGQSDTALLILDYQIGVGDLSYAQDAASRAAIALEAGRKAGLCIVFSKVMFRPGYADISASNRSFQAVKEADLMPPEASKLIPRFQPRSGEILVNKNRFSVFSGNDLKQLLRSKPIKTLVMAGVATSGVILSTFAEAADEDYEMAVLSDACADPKASLHQELTTSLFPRSATVVSVDQWTASLSKSEH